MGTAKAFNDILKKELRVHAAWMPIGNGFRLGDYGLISGGVFAKLGNISDDFKIVFSKRSGPASTIDFASTGVTSVNVDAKASVDVVTEPLSAKLKVDFANADSFLIKAELHSFHIDDIASLAGQLSELDGWHRRYKVLSTVHVASNCLILSSKSDGSSIEMSGGAEVLQTLGVAGAKGLVKVESRSNMGLEIVGRKGVVAIEMFKLGMFSGRPKLLSKEERAVYEPIDCGSPTEDDI